MPRPVFCLMGPTASGKTAFACELATRFPLEIISVDSALVYREMNIGTAKPDPQTLASIPHHLVDILNPDAVYSAAAFTEAVPVLCEMIFNKGKIPLLVGGTMLYFRALQEGLSALPPANQALRNRLSGEAREAGWEAMHARLHALDPVSGARIHAHDTQRIIRALEVSILTGKPYSQALNHRAQPGPWQFVNIILMPEDRAWLHARIASRFTSMLEAGFINEVEGLLARWPLNGESPAMRCTGYRQVFEYLSGDLDSGMLARKGTEATRQLAKRQMTWLRHWPQAHTLVAESPSTGAEIMAIVQKILDN